MDVLRRVRETLYRYVLKLGAIFDNIQRCLFETEDGRFRSIRAIELNFRMYFIGILRCLKGTQSIHGGTLSYYEQ